VLLAVRVLLPARLFTGVCINLESIFHWSEVSIPQTAAPALHVSLHARFFTGVRSKFRSMFHWRFPSFLHSQAAASALDKKGKQAAVLNLYIAMVHWNTRKKNIDQTRNSSFIY
jgi:hypothetical protein